MKPPIDPDLQNGYTVHDAHHGGIPRTPEEIEVDRLTEEWLVATGKRLVPIYTHGTRNSYTRGCRCELCRAANAAYSRARRAL